MFAYSIGEHQQGSAISDLDESRHVGKNQSQCENNLGYYIMAYISFIQGFLFRSLKLHLPVLNFGLGVANRMGLITIKG